MRLTDFFYNLLKVCKCERLKTRIFKFDQDEAFINKARIKLAREMDLKQFIKTGRLIHGFLKAFLSPI